MSSCAVARVRLLAILCVCGGLLAFAGSWGLGSVTRPPVPVEHHIHHDHILGTSLDLWIVGSDEAAQASERAILAEIERLGLIFSTYDPQSELSRLNQTQRPMTVSSDLIAVLRAYETWQVRSGGAFNGQLGELVRVWQHAQTTGVEPNAATLADIVARVAQPGWHIDPHSRRVTRLTDQPLNLNSIAKGYIIQHALAAGRQPGVTGILLNLGGDMLAWGTTAEGGRTWRVGVQDPQRPEVNAPLLTTLKLSDRAVASSGGYERYYTIGGKRYSHLFDPRTGRPADGIAGATVVANDSMTANALATTLCILPPQEGLRLVAATPGAECLLVTREGRQFRSPGLNEVAAKLPQALQDKDKKDAWPDGFQINVTLTLPKITTTRKYRKPYVAIWIEDAGKPVRSVTVWGNDKRWLKDLPQWWKFARNDRDLVKATTRATRAPGKYQIVWDGKDDAGKSLPQGTYTIQIEVHREHGKLVRQTGKIVCGTEEAELMLAKNAETEETIVKYERKK